MIQRKIEQADAKAARKVPDSGPQEMDHQPDQTVEDEEIKVDRTTTANISPGSQEEEETITPMEETQQDPPNGISLLQEIKNKNKKDKTAAKVVQAVWLDEMMESRRAEITCPKENCQAVGRMVWNGQSGAGKTAKCTVCSKKVGRRNLYEHVATQLQQDTPGPSLGVPQKLTFELPENPPSTVQEWRRFREQFARMVATTNTMAAELQEVKRQLHQTTKKLAEKEKEKGSKPPKHKHMDVPGLPRPQREALPRAPTSCPEEEGDGRTVDTANFHPQDKDKTKGSPPAQEATTASPSVRKSYLEIAKLKKPQLEAFPEVVRERVTAGKAALAAFVRPQTQRQLRPEAVYFKNAQRGSLSKLREALRISLPGEAVLHLDFIGGSLLEVICHAPLVPKLISHIKYMSDGRMSRVAFEPLAKPTVTRGNLGSDKGLWARNIRNCLRRIDRILKGQPWKEVRAHFQKMREEAKALQETLEHQQCEQEDEGEDGWTRVINKKKSTQGPPRENQEKEKDPTQANENQ